MNSKSNSLGDYASSPTSVTEATGTSRRNVVVGATLLGAAATIAAPAAAQTSKAPRVTLSYYPWIKQGISAPDLRAAVDKFASVLQEALGKTLTVDLQPVMEIPDQLEDMKRPPAGDVVGRIGLLNPIGYTLIRRDPGVEGIAVIRRKIGTDVGPTYKAQLYTNWKSKITKVSEVRGRSIAYGSPQSTSNFLVPAMRLWEAKIHPLNGFNRVEFAGGHDTAALAVYEGRLEVGAGHDGAVLGLAGRRGYEDAGDVLVNIDWSDPIPSDPVAIHTPIPRCASRSPMRFSRSRNPTIRLRPGTSRSGDSGIRMRGSSRSLRRRQSRQRSMTRFSPSWKRWGFAATTCCAGYRAVAVRHGVEQPPAVPPSLRLWVWEDDMVEARAALGLQN